MTLPIQTIIDTHEALEDWRFTAQEVNQVIAGVGESLMGAMVLTAMIGMFGMVASKNPSNPNPSTHQLGSTPVSVKLYHCTATENVSSILKQGLLPCGAEMMFFFPTLGVAERAGLDDMAILEVSLTDEEVDKCEVGEIFPELYIERYGKPPPTDITLREYLHNPGDYDVAEICCTVDKIPANRVKYVKTIRH